MAGWTREKRRATEAAFYAFLQRCFINSKDHGRICLGDNLYEGQTTFITAVFDALERDIHKIFVLKSRQLGLSTISRALSIFLLGWHPGLKGAIVFDTDNNKSEARSEIETMIKDLPAAFRFPNISGNNRTGLTLSNDSKVLFMSAGVRKSKTSGTLGRSVGLSLAHLSELCSYDNDDGLEAFEQSLSDVNPDRLYIYESTARGFNRWSEMWKEARKDTAHCVCVFLGWWAKPAQRIDQRDPDFKLYGMDAPTPKEQKRIALVLEKYGHQVTVEELAWIRRKMNPSVTVDRPADTDGDENTTRLQEQPWTEEEAFQQTGSVFFSDEKLTEQTNKFVSNKFTAYRFITGAAFSDMIITKAETFRAVELKVWDEPDHEGVYVVSIDPAYGENENNCRSSIQVMRCFADGIDQVAEYASPLATTYQLAWVIASILGWYGANNAEVRYILELNGPGAAVFNELRSLRHQIDAGFRAREIEEKGLKDIFRNVRTYIYTRPDALGAGFNYHFKTNMQLKITLMERVRDFTSNGMLHIRSLDLIDEMKTVAREGDSIKAPGTMKDDRVVAAALGVYYWETQIQRRLIAERRTRDAEAAKKRLSIKDQVSLFQQNTLMDFFKQKQVARGRQQISNLRASWRYR